MDGLCYDVEKGGESMKDHRIAGPLLRLLRLQRNWSQETLCHGICTVSYLSKIEQGKVEANRQLLADLFDRLGVTWQESPEMEALRDALYEGIFSWDEALIRQKIAELDEKWEQMTVGPCYADFIVVRAYHHRKPEWVPKELEPLLDVRQRALLALLRDRHEEAYRIYPCPLTAICIGEEALLKGKYMLSMEYFYLAYDMAAREGYAYMMLFAQHCMAASCSDMGNLEAMYRHSRIAERLARALGADDTLKVIRYNIAATRVEYGDYEGGYAYFSAMEEPDAMALHKLAVCCEALGRREEAMAALQRAEGMESEVTLKNEICALVRYRLEHQDYLHDPAYGELLLRTYEQIAKELSSGFARFHLPRVTEWLTANRQYRKAFEILNDFPENRTPDGFT